MCKSSNIDLHTNMAVSFGNTFMGVIIKLKHECFYKCSYKFLNILIKSLKHFQGWYKMLCWKIHVYVYSFYVKLGNTWNPYIQYLFVYQGLCMVSKPRWQNMQKKKTKKKNSPFKNITDSNIRIGSLLHGWGNKKW